MPPTPEERVVESWTNGSMADVYLVEREGGDRRISKRYRRGAWQTVNMWREWLVLSYLGRVPGVPRVLGFHPMRRELVLSYLPGERLLEWVLARYGDPGWDLERFQSFHGLEGDPDVAKAFERFRRSADAEATRLREAIRLTYSRLHGLWFVHGDPSPRNVLYDGTSVSLIDFDHARPSRNPPSIDAPRLLRWYGVQ